MESITTDNQGKMDNSIRKKLTLGISTLDKELSFLEFKNKDDDSAKLNFNVNNKNGDPVMGAKIIVKNK